MRQGSISQHKLVTNMHGAQSTQYVDIRVIRRYYLEADLIEGPLLAGLTLHVLLERRLNPTGGSRS
jgi:hypothetical protein